MTERNEWQHVKLIEPLKAKLSLKSSTYDGSFIGMSFLFGFVSFAHKASGDNDH